MEKRIVLLAALFLFIYYNVSMASSGGIPPVASKKTSYHPVAKTPAAKDTSSKSKTTTQPVVISQRKTIVKESVKTKTVNKALLEKKKIIRQKKASLNNSKWDIEVVPLRGGEKTKDAAAFKDNKVAIESLLDRGFSYTNYTLTVKDNGVFVWETMQTKTTGEVAFIRGEVASDTTSMRGIISFPKGSVSQDYSFKSTSKHILSK